MRSFVHRVKCYIQKYIIRCRYETNPFQDIKIIHEDRGRLENISVSLDSVEELDSSALESTIAQLIAAELVKTHCIDISKVTDSNNIVHYVGKIVVVDDEDRVVIDPISIEDS